MAAKLPVLELPASTVTLVPAYVCRRRAIECEALAETCLNPRLRRHLIQEAREWRKLAQERER